MRVQPRTGRVRPYAEGLAGFSYAHTSTGAALGDHAGTSTTHLGDFAPTSGTASRPPAAATGWPPRSERGLFASYRTGQVVRYEDAGAGDGA